MTDNNKSELSELSTYEVEKRTRYNRVFEVAGVAAAGVSLAIYPLLAPQATEIMPVVGQILLAGGALGAIWAASTVAIQKAITFGLDKIKGKDDATLELEKRTAQVEANIRENSIGKSEKEIKASIKEFNKEQRTLDVQESYKDDSYDDIRNKSRFQHFAAAGGIIGGVIGLGHGLTHQVTGQFAQQVFERVVYTGVMPVAGFSVGAVVFSATAKIVMDVLNGKNDLDAEITRKYNAEGIDNDDVPVKNKIKQVRASIEGKEPIATIANDNQSMLQSKIKLNRPEIDPNLTHNNGMQLKM